MSRRRRYNNVNSVKEVTDRMLSTLEGRREQITNRSTICLAATSGLLVLAVQFIFDISDMNDYAQYRWVSCALLICIIICAWSIITSLDLIKKISRNRHMGRGQRATDPNIFYFGWLETQDESQLNSTLENLTLKQQVEFEVRQAISLSKNLDYRYKQLDRTYRLFIVSLCIYVISTIAFWIIKYDIINMILSSVKCK